MKMVCFYCGAIQRDLDEKLREYLVNDPKDWIVHPETDALLIVCDGCDEDGELRLLEKEELEEQCKEE